MYEIIESTNFAVPKRDNRADMADRFRNDRQRVKSQDQIKQSKIKRNQDKRSAENEMMATSVIDEGYARPHEPEDPPDSERNEFDEMNEYRPNLPRDSSYNRILGQAQKQQ